MTPAPSGARASYGPLLGVYVLAVGAASVLVHRRGRPVEPSTRDIALLGVATFKLSRLVTKDKVLEPVREPFVESTSAGEGAEVNSEPAGTGARRAIGELLTCPFCLAVWIATALTVTFTVAPRAVRLAASGLAAVVLADLGQYGFTWWRSRALGAASEGTQSSRK